MITEKMNIIKPGEVPFPFSGSNMALWKCDEPSGTILYDASGRGNHCEFASGANSPTRSARGFTTFTGDDYAGAKPIITRSELSAGQLLCSIAAPYGFIDGVAIRLSAEQISSLSRAVIVITGTGNAWGYIGENGIGETLGNNIGSLSPINFFSGWTAFSAVIVDGNTFTSTAPPGEIVSNSILTNGYLYKSYLSGSTTAGIVRIKNPNSPGNNYVIGLGNTGYSTAPNTRAIDFYVSVIATVDIDPTTYMKQVFTATVNGMKIYSSKTNNILSINTNTTFNPNAITKMDIYPSNLNFLPSEKGITVWSVIIPNGADEDGFIIAKYDNVLGYGLQWIGSSDRIGLYYDAGNSRTSDAVFTENSVPVFVATVIDISGTVTFYHNKNAAGSSTGVTISDNFPPMTLCKRFGSTSSSVYFNGTFCIGGVLKRNISQPEIEDLYEYAKRSLVRRGVFLP